VKSRSGAHKKMGGKKKPGLTINNNLAWEEGREKKTSAINTKSHGQKKGEDRTVDDNIKRINEKKTEGGKEKKHATQVLNRDNFHSLSQIGVYGT